MNLEDIPEAYRASVSVHFPNISIGEMAVRSELMAIRDRAASGLARCAPEASGPLAEVSRLATICALSGQSPASLTLVLMACENLMRAATFLQKATRL